MIEYKVGDIFESGAEAIVNTVNCVGVMGKGIALQCKKLYPYNYQAYRLACEAGMVVPGKMFVHNLQTLVNPRYIINFPTKQHWKFPSKMEYIETGLKDFVDMIVRLNIASVAVPPLGCGLGGLSWGAVKPMIESAVRELQGVDIFIYDPQG